MMKGEAEHEDDEDGNEQVLDVAEQKQVVDEEEEESAEAQDGQDGGF
jgi:hypothetical protein